LLSSTFGNKLKGTYLNEIQHMINLNILTYLLKVSIDKNAFLQVKNSAMKSVNLIKNNHYNNFKSFNEDYHLLINDFNNNPEKYNGKLSKKIPDGSPIGTESCNFNYK
jgi:hypothetical protein